MRLSCFFCAAHGVAALPCLSLPPPGEGCERQPPHPLRVLVCPPWVCASKFLCLVTLRCNRLFLANDIHPGLSWASLLQVPDCCPGFFGTLCEPCPGGLGGVCSGHGQCQDRLLGSGECRCQEGFHGTACEMCELGRYGPTCSGGEICKE